MKDMATWGGIARWGARMGTVAVFLALAVVGPVTSAMAWGRQGHRACALYAESLLTREAKLIIHDLLEPGETLADAATWADENGREIRGSASWHYVNVPVSALGYRQRDCRTDGCVVSKIKEFGAVLADRGATKAQRRQALRFTVHLIQDLHQPMHVADRNDRGGNALQLQHRLRSGWVEGTNLHQLWDSGLFRERYRGEEGLLRELRTLGDKPEAREWLRGSTEDWANESLALGKRAYKDPKTDSLLRNGETVGRDYEDSFSPLAARRLAQAGRRLAAELNQILR